MNLSIIADCAGSAVIQELISMGFSYFGDHLLPADSNAELKRLRAALPQITTVMGIAEALKMKDPSVCQWVKQFRQAVDASEDLLDELEYKKLEDMVKDRDEAGGSASSSKKRKPCSINDDTLERLKEVVTMLDQAANGVEHLLQVATVLGIHDLSESQQQAGKVLSRNTTFLLYERDVDVCGRENDMLKIIDGLKRPTDACLSSFGVVGMGGIGKTTLVELVYHRMCRSNHFEKTIWVCASTKFSVEDIIRQILGALGENNCSKKPLNALQETLKRNIHLKKILLILDDIWDDKKRDDWVQLIAPLMFVQKGSKILFTTRMKSVADLLASVISTEHECFSLHGLTEHNSLALFLHYAFRGIDHVYHIDLEAIAKQILKILHGHPLATKVIGNLFNSCVDRQYWRRILNHISIFNLEQAKDVVEVLKLSYYHLPADLQVCFRYCSIFPRGHLFDKNDLIRMWIASGFIRKELCQKERPEDIGKDYFNHLLRKSFFECSYVAKGTTRYVLHDLMHELATLVSRGECFRIEPNSKMFTIPSTVRHASIHASEIEMISQLENLRSLVITTSTEKTGTDPDLFVIPNNFIKKSLRVLKINGFRITELPGETSHLVHLRYLSIDNLSLLMEPLRSLIPIRYLYVEDCSGMEELPEQWLLQHRSTITVLVINDASSLKSLPETMVRLTALEVLQISQANLLEELPELPASLRRLVIGDAHSLISLPATMARLTALEVLQISKANLLEELPELPVSLRKLVIGDAHSLRSLSATMVRLAALKNLRTLCFNNGNVES